MTQVSYDRNESTIVARQKVLISVGLGILAGWAAAMLGKWQIALLVSWNVAAVVYIIWTWRVIWPLNGEHTAKHAVREDPSRGAADITMLLASVLSLAAIGLMLYESASLPGSEQYLGIGFSVLSVIIGWIMLHTLFTLHYAELYYTSPHGGIDFGKTDKPTYQDFAYVAFTIGMTFQVSDTNLETARIRKTALRHALLSYMFGTVIVASTINLILSLGK
jgi:uncharacterized membrane protein